MRSLAHNRGQVLETLTIFMRVLTDQITSQQRQVFIMSNEQSMYLTTIVYTQNSTLENNNQKAVKLVVSLGICPSSCSNRSSLIHGTERNMTLFHGTERVDNVFLAL